MRFPHLFLILLLFTSTASAQVQVPLSTPTPTPSPEADDTVKISTTLIQLDITVTDKNGKIIKDLKPEDFEVYENGVKQNISNFSFVSRAFNQAAAPTDALKLNSSTPLRAEQVRRTVTLVVDDLNVAVESIPFVIKSLRKFVDEQMQPGDLVAIIQTGKGIGALQQFTSNKQQLHAAIDKIKFNPLGRGGEELGYKYTRPQEDLEVGLVDIEAEQKAIRESTIAVTSLRSLNYIIQGMKDLPGRKTIMYFSEGFRTWRPTPVGPERDIRVQGALEQITDSALRSSVVVNVMDVRGLDAYFNDGKSTRGIEINESRDGLVSLAERTGGINYFDSNNFNQDIQKMLDAGNDYYLIAYEPDADTFDEKTRRFNKLQIKVNRKDAIVRYRSGFFGVEEKNEAGAKIVGNNEKNALRPITKALTSPFAANDINVRFNALFGSEATIGTYVHSLLYVNAKDLKFIDTTTGEKKADFEILAMSFDETGSPVDHINKTFTLTVKGADYEKILRDGFVYSFVFPIKKPGAYQVRAAIRDAASEKIGSGSQFIEIPDLKKSCLTLSGIILENFSPNQWQQARLSTNITQSGEADTRSVVWKTDPLTDTSLRRFKRGSVLRYGVEVYNVKKTAAEKPDLSSQIILFRDGRVVFTGKPTPIDIAGQTGNQAINAMGAVNLSSEMLPGDYVMQIVITDNKAKDKAKTSTQLVQFEVTE